MTFSKRQFKLIYLIEEDGESSRVVETVYADTYHADFHSIDFYVVDEQYDNRLIMVYTIPKEDLLEMQEIGVKH